MGEASSRVRAPSTPAIAPPLIIRGSRGRLVFADALRVAVIVMVIVHHAAQAYGPTGGAWPVSDRARSDWFLPFFTVNAAVGLGLLFLLAGYFTASSYERKGTGRFLRERWARIGVPLVIFALGVHLPLVYLYESRPSGEFVRSLHEDGWQGIYFHLWFLGHVLLYSAVYVGWRKLAHRAHRPLRTLAPPKHAVIAGFVLGLVLITWIVRWSYPVDEWVPLLFAMPAEPANLPQYVSLFSIGVIAYRSDWFRRMPTSVGMTWLGVGLVAATVVYVMEPLGLWYDPRATGGFNWPSLVRVTFEALIGTGLSVGLVVLFREVFHRPTRLLVAMASTSYAAYILHLYIVVGLQVAILALELPVFVKFALVAALGTVLSFGIAHLSQGVPGARVILGTTPGRRGRNRAALFATSDRGADGRARRVRIAGPDAVRRAIAPKVVRDILAGTTNGFQEPTEGATDGQRNKDHDARGAVPGEGGQA